MWLHGDFLVPHLNGEIYSEKPPLLFWLYHLGWTLFGVGDIWPRMVSPLFGAASLFLTARLARRLWPERPAAAQTAPLIAMSCTLWMIFMSAAMFDMLMVFFTLAGVMGIIRSWQDRDFKGWLILGGAIGLGILAKGPVILLHTLPLALLAPWWAIDNRPARWLTWYAGTAFAVVMGALIALAWAVPAALAGGEQYSQAIFWGQSAGRMVKSFAHKRPLWWYLPLLPVLLFPWLLWPALWRAFRSLAGQPPSSSVRLCVAWLVPVLALFSLISGKQVHYLLPAFPAFALISAYALDRSEKHQAWDPLIPGVIIILIGFVFLTPSIFPYPQKLSLLLSKMNPYYGIVLIIAGPTLYNLYSLNFLSGMLRTALMSASTLLMVMMLYLSFAGVFTLYDLKDISSYVARLQDKGAEVSYVGTYHGQFNFLGRLAKPVEVVQPEQVEQWAADHPDGCIVADERHLELNPDIRPEYQSPWGYHIYRVWKGRSIAPDKHRRHAAQ